MSDPTNIDERVGVSATAVQVNWTITRMVSDIGTLVLTLLVTLVLLSVGMLTLQVALCELISAVIVCVILVCMDVYLLRREKKELSVAQCKFVQVNDLHAPKNYRLASNSTAANGEKTGNDTDTEPNKTGETPNEVSKNPNTEETDSPIIVSETAFDEGKLAIPAIVDESFLDRYVTAKTENSQARWGLLGAVLTVVGDCVTAVAILIFRLMDPLYALVSLAINLGIGVVVSVFHGIKMWRRDRAEWLFQKKLAEEASKSSNSIPSSSVTSLAMVAGQNVATRQKCWVMVGEMVLTIGQLALTIFSKMVRLDFLPLAKMAISGIAKCIVHFFLFLSHVCHVGWISTQFSNVREFIRSHGKSSSVTSVGE